MGTNGLAQMKVILRKSLRFARMMQASANYSINFFRVLMFCSLKMLFPWGVYM
jgi:hypothetical protein